MKNYKKTSFLSLTIGWIGLIVTHIIWSNLNFYSASGGDTGVILFWASFFLLIFYGIFVLWPRKLIVRLAESLNLVVFALISGIYALIGFVILIGWIFLFTDFTGVFIDTFVFGLIFGIVFHIIWKNYKNLISKKHLVPILIFPFVFLFIYLVVFPKLAPSLAFNSSPQYVRHDILKKTIPKFKIGDELSNLQKALPGEFNFENCKGNNGAILGDFQYEIVVNCCKIVRIKYGPRNGEGISFGGEIEKPCK